MRNLLTLTTLVVGLFVIAWGAVEAAPPNNKPPNNRPPNNRPPNNRPPNNKPPHPHPHPKPPVVVPNKNINLNKNNNVNTNIGINKNNNVANANAKAKANANVINRNANVATAVNRNSNDVSIRLNLSKNSNGNTNSNNRGFGNPGGFGYGWPMDGYGFGAGAGYYNPPPSPPSYSYSPTGGAYAPNFTSNPTYNFGGYGMPFNDPNFVPNPNVVPLNAANNETASITLEVPSEEAEVWFNGAKMPYKGLVRKYVTPPLKKDKLYNYEIKVQWPFEKGQPFGAKIKYSTSLQIKAGDDISHTVPEEGDGKVTAPMPKVELQPQDESRLMNQRLNWAKELLKEGKTDAAKNRLKDIASKSPDSPAGQEAKALLDKMQ